MTKIKSKLSLIQSKTGTVAVNSSFKYKNEKILANSSAMNQTTQHSKNIIKFVDFAEDIARLRDPEKKESIDFTKIVTSIKPDKIFIPMSSSTSSGTATASRPITPRDIIGTADDKVIRSILSGAFTPIFDEEESDDNEVAIIEETSGPVVDGVFINDSVNLDELFIFGDSSFFMMPLNPEMAESWTGSELSVQAKPRIIATIAENIRNGYPTRNVVLVKRLVSTTALAVKYTIYRKSVFREREFKAIKELAPSEIELDQEYEELIQSVGLSVNHCFSFIDQNVDPNLTYVYKIGVDWIGASVNETTESNTNADGTPDDSETGGFTLTPESLQTILSGSSRYMSKFTL